MTVRIGHAHLKVRDLDRAIAFYRDLIGLHLTERIGDGLAFLTAGPMHHELALQNVGPAAPAPPPRGTGLYHVAFEVPDQEALADRYRRLTNQGVPVHLVDHRISWAMYFSDPDGNGLELYWDTRREADGVPLWHGSDRALTPERL